MLESTVLNTNYDLAEMKDLCLPNLLDNADFRSGIINQRGFDNTTITGWSKKGTIDRWIFSGSGNATAEIDTDSMSISGDSSLIQTLSQQYQPGTYTAATNITDLTGTLKISLVYSDDTSIDETISGIGLFVHTFEATKDVKAIMFRCVGASSSFTFDSIKLEKGSVFTGMPQWDFALEWFKCQRYLYIVVDSSILNARYDGSNLCINFKTPMSFVNKPSIIHNNAKFGVTSFNGSYENHNVSDFTVNTYDGGNINIIKPSSNPTRYGMAIVVNGFYLDAEIY